jgi:sulfiredoxin
VTGGQPGMDRAWRSPQNTAAMLMKDQSIPIEAIYVPTKRRSTLDPATVEKLAESILAEGQRTPILVRPDGDRFVLVEGLHRLEACKALGETKISALLVQARKS